MSNQIPTSSRIDNPFYTLILRNNRILTNQSIILNNGLHEETIRLMLLENNNNFTEDSPEVFGDNPYLIDITSQITNIVDTNEYIFTFLNRQPTIDSSSGSTTYDRPNSANYSVIFNALKSETSTTISLNDINNTFDPSNSSIRENLQPGVASVFIPNTNTDTNQFLVYAIHLDKTNSSSYIGEGIQKLTIIILKKKKKPGGDFILETFINSIVTETQIIYKSFYIS